VAAVACVFMTFTSCFATEINTASKCRYISEKTRPLTPPAACSRSLCPYPQEARYVGAADGNLADASNYACMAPK
jgi:hypothetical protein